MKYRIDGADSTTGVDRYFEVEASSEKDAIRFANEEGILPYKLSRVGDAISKKQPVASPRPRVQSVAQQQWNNQFVGAIITGVVFVVIFVMCSGVFNSRSASSSSPSPSYAPSKSYDYQESSDRELKNLPSLQGYSESEKEHIISEAKKLNAVVKESERNRGD